MGMHYILKTMDPAADSLGEVGLDTIGTGATIAWAMECFENDLLGMDEIAFPAPFGDAAAMVRLVKMIAGREGIGDVLANGSRRADHQSSEHDPMIEDGASDLYLERLALLGFDHPLPPGSLGPQKVRFALKGQHFYSFLDSAALCQFVWGPAWTL